MEDKKRTEKKTKKVISGNVKVKKKSELQKIGNAFIAEDIKKVKNYVLLDVIVPAIKKTISDIITTSTDMILYNDNHYKNKTIKRSYDNDAYWRASNSRSMYHKPTTYNNSKYSYNDILFETRGDADEVLMKLEEIISMYGEAKVADLYDAVGVTSDFTDNDYGWTDIRSAKVLRARDGFIIKLPRPEPLD